MESSTFETSSREYPGESKEYPLAGFWPTLPSIAARHIDYEFFHFSLKGFLSRKNRVLSIALKVSASSILFLKKEAVILH